MKTLNMPSFGADMAEGTLVEWHIKPGDTVKRGDVIALIETSKGAIDFDVFEEGVVEALLAQEGDVVSVGTPILQLQGDQPEEPEPATAPPVEQQVAVTPLPIPRTPVVSDPGFVPASPAARRLARTRQLELAACAPGSGPGGAILLADLEHVAAGPGETPPPVKPASSAQTGPQGGFDPRQMREAISATVSRSKREIPHYYLATELDLDTCQHFLGQYNNEREPEQRLLLPALLYSALAHCLAKSPSLNGHYLQDGFHPVSGVDLATAIKLRGGGLVMPVIRQAQQLDPTAMMAAIKGQVARARSGQLRQSELGDGSCAVTSLGDRGVGSIFGVILPPQVAIVGLGQLQQRPVVKAQTVCPGFTMTATLAADHRVSDGHDGARFLNAFNQALQQPEALWTEPT